jgi:aspartyl/asparaginyl-tRNA synthetase
MQCSNLENLRKANFHIIWKIINTIKAIMPIRSVLTHIGRYYFSENGYIVSFIEMLTNSISIFYDLL